MSFSVLITFWYFLGWWKRWMTQFLPYFIWPSNIFIFHALYCMSYFNPNFGMKPGHQLNYPFSHTKTRGGGVDFFSIFLEVQRILWWWKYQILWICEGWVHLCWKYFLFFQLCFPLFDHLKLFKSWRIDGISCGFDFCLIFSTKKNGPMEKPIGTIWWNDLFGPKWAIFSKVCYRQSIILFR